MNDPHVKHMNLVREMYLPNGVKTNTIAFPVNISEVGFDVYRAPPELGAHNEEVASEWGIRKMG
jgi:crotonobetainyl-CoA:carnitine CoA-transferase CaiB-like acyl-CoA transferase